MRLGRLLSIAAALVFVPALVPAQASAAPQILALVATNGPVPLECRNGDCVAILASICLQKDRPAPANGTVYEPATADAVRVLATGKDGKTRTLPGSGLVNIASQGNFLTVRLSVSEETLEQLGLRRAAIVVAANAALLPKPIAGDAKPQTGKEIAQALGSLRTEAAWIDDFKNPQTNRARMTNRLLSQIPAFGPIDEIEARKAFERVSQDSKGQTGLREFSEMYAFCEGNRTWTIHGRNMRECLEQWRDNLMMEQNMRHWSITGAGS